MCPSSKSSSKETRGKIIKKSREEARAPPVPGCIHFQTWGTRALGTRPLCWCLLSCFLKAGAQLHRAFCLLCSGDVPGSVHHPYLLHTLLATCILKFRYQSGRCSFEIYVFFFLLRSCMLGMSNWKKIHYVNFSLLYFYK